MADLAKRSIGRISLWESYGWVQVGDPVTLSGYILYAVEEWCDFSICYTLLISSVVVRLFLIVTLCLVSH